MQRKCVITCVVTLLFAGIAAPKANAVTPIEPGQAQNLAAVPRSASTLSARDITASPSLTPKSAASTWTPFVGGRFVPPASQAIHIFTPDEMSAYPTFVNGVEFSGETWKEMSPQARSDLFNKLGDLGRTVAADRNMARTDWYINLGRFVYFHDLSPTDQRWFLQAGGGALAAAICAASAGTACAIAGVLAAGLITGVGEYFHPTCWITVAFTYNGHPELSEFRIDHC